jgi:hypothetical protein
LPGDADAEESWHGRPGAVPAVAPGRVAEGMGGTIRVGSALRTVSPALEQTVPGADPTKLSTIRLLTDACASSPSPGTPGEGEGAFRQTAPLPWARDSPGDAPPLAASQIGEAATPAFSGTCTVLEESGAARRGLSLECSRPPAPLCPGVEVGPSSKSTDRTRAFSPSHGTPGEGWGEGAFRSMAPRPGGSGTERP